TAYVIFTRLECRRVLFGSSANGLPFLIYGKALCPRANFPAPAFIIAREISPRRGAHDSDMPCRPHGRFERTAPVTIPPSLTRDRAEGRRGGKGGSAQRGVA